ncbi:hypothetical protein MKW98_006057 [Papaver atlanticum]|uniref:DDE Tnp4 domain-containing protein n=1 Tax=Papaver atlanticum TaxID=357466 RepID=A0AAD4TG83_9MAGN|nr:hypothetical protein MKW98_006057 [Papaver atlanticum]
MCPYRNIRYWIGDYRRVPPTEKEEKFNQAHARLRNVIERAFGVLKVRFPVLSKLPSYSFETQRDIVIACMSIHNFLRRNALDDWLFKEYENETFDMNEAQVEVEAETEENAPRLFGRQEHIYITNLRDEIASLL